MSFLEVMDVKKSFGNTEVLKDVNLSLENGEQCVIKGASGSGKSTLLHLIGGLDRVNSGKIVLGSSIISEIDDEKLANFRNHEIGFVFQFHYLLPSMSCLDNMLLPARIGNCYSREIRDRVTKLALDLGISFCFKRYPYELSGGEQQRVSIIRALSLTPKLLLCDEPTGNLDSTNSNLVVSLLCKISQEFKATTVVVTHDEHVASFFKKELIMKDGRLH